MLRAAARLNSRAPRAVRLACVGLCSIRRWRSPVRQASGWPSIVAFRRCDTCSLVRGMAWASIRESLPSASAKGQQPRGRNARHTGRNPQERGRARNSAIRSNRLQNRSILTRLRHGCERLARPAPDDRNRRPAEAPLGRSRCIRCIGTTCARDRSSSSTVAVATRQTRHRSPVARGPRVAEAVA
jgi:hypothetical protein